MRFNCRSIQGTSISETDVVNWLHNYRHVCVTITRTVPLPTNENVTWLFWRCLYDQHLIIRGSCMKKHFQ